MSHVRRSRLRPSHHLSHHLSQRRSGPRYRPVRPLALLAAAALLVGGSGQVATAHPASTGAAASSAADPAPAVPADGQVIGGCRIAFDAAGTPAATATSDKPCVGLESLRLTATGDLELRLTRESSSGAVNLTVSPGADLVSRGIVASAGGGSTVVVIRLYDDVRSGRVDLRTSQGRARVARTSLYAGWTKAARLSTAASSTTPGHDALGRYRDRAAVGTSTVRGGCVVRFPDGRPAVHANGSHRCIGVSAVRVSATGKVSIRMSAEQRGAVVGVQADPDETLTTRGVLAGVSVSASEVVVGLYDARSGRALDLRREADRRAMRGATSNLWVSWTKTTDRPGSPNARTDVATDRYGPYMDGSATPDSVTLHGCSVNLDTSGHPAARGGAVRLCTGVRGVRYHPAGDVEVLGMQGTGVISTTTVSSRGLTDYGIRAGLSGGAGSSRYRFYSLRLERALDLSRWADRQLLRRSDAELLVGWTRPTPVTTP